MKLLLFQAKRFSWATFAKRLEQAKTQKVNQTVKQAIVVFIQVEADDDINTKLETRAIKNIQWLAGKRRLKNVVLHPFTHLSSSSASPEFAQKALERLALQLNQAGYRVWLTPFGYFCEWDIAVYGDALAKVFKDI